MRNLFQAIKILSSKQIRAADAYTIEHEPIKSVDLMERASKAFLHWFTNRLNNQQAIKVFCGIGNNGGDGLAISRLLVQKGYQVETFVIGNLDKASPDFKLNFERLNEISLLKSIKDFPSIEPTDIIIDGIFGSGLSRPVEGLYADLINHINSSLSENVIAIDIPSGLFSDKPTPSGAIIKATETISFQVPKLSFLLPESASYCGDFQIVDIGLDTSFIQDIDSSYYLVNDKLIKSIFKKRGKFMHKGNAGRCLLVAGSKGKIGAGILATKACLRSGSGLVTIQTPHCGNIPVQTAVPEAMVIDDKSGVAITEISNAANYNAIGIGPGIGTSKETNSAIVTFLKSYEKPLVIDADAINIISQNQEVLNDVPVNSIFTPHPGEFNRLVGNSTNDFDRLEKQIQFSKKHKLIVLLKGAHTSITSSNGLVFFNSTGNPGMATAGSGDVLTGIITSFLGQGYKPIHAAILGAYIHGMSGDLFVEKNSMEGLIAGDLIKNLPKTFNAILQQ